MVAKDLRFMSRASISSNQVDSEGFFGLNPARAASETSHPEL
jgi:hypothetical protein